MHWKFASAFSSCHTRNSSSSLRCRCLSVSFSTHTCTRTHSGQPKVGFFFEVEVDRRKVPPSRLSSSSSPCAFSPAIERRGSTQSGLFWKSRNKRRVLPGDFFLEGSCWKKCEQHTSHVTFSRTLTRTCVAQGSSRKFGVRTSHLMRHLHALMMCV